MNIESNHDRWCRENFVVKITSAIKIGIAGTRVVAGTVVTRTMGTICVTAIALVAFLNGGISISEKKRNDKNVNKIYFKAEIRE